MATKVKTAVEVQIPTKQIIVNKDHVYQVGEEFLPSVTTINSAFAKGKGYEKWLSSHSEEEQESILEETSLTGRKVHRAIEHLLSGQRIVPAEFVYIDEDGVEHKGLKSNESKMLTSFVRFWFEYKPKVLAYEKVVYSETRKYAGTVDFIGTIKEGLIDPKSANPKNELMFVIDWKTGSGIHYAHHLQVAAYAEAETEMTGKKVDRIAILRLGTKHKSGYEFKVLDSISKPYRAFLGVFEAWKYENPNFGPKIIEVPAYFQLPKIETVKIKTIKKRKNDKGTK